ncbi:MAG: hypothetical protein IJ737_06215 [Ruminococcus sp.]|nr:hypothetical protein [Ruminococcus sp.]
MTELERAEQAENYVNRYFEFDDAVSINLENKEYLKTYIKDVNKIEEEFDIKKKTTRSIIILVIVAVVLFLLFLLALGIKMILVPIVVALFVLIPGIIFFRSLHKYRLDAARKHQAEVNDGIKEQIEILDLRTQQLEKQRDDYLTALRKKIDFIELDDDNIHDFGKIKGFIESGEAETCEDAVALYEQSQLMAQMTSIMSKSERKVEMDMEKNKERFGDPLELIKENKKKKKLEKKKKKEK